MKIKSYLLLFVLIVILFFILGVRYGQKVEKTNKAINYFLSITPSPTIPITPTPYKYATYEGKLKRINKIIYPSFLKLKENSTTSAVILEQE